MLSLFQARMIGKNSRTESDEQDLRSSRGLTIRTKLLLFTISIGCLIVASLSIIAFFLSAIALRNTRLEGLQSLRTSLVQVVRSFFENERRDISTQSELRTFVYSMTELSSAYEHLLDDLDSAGFKPDEAFMVNVESEVREAYEKGPMSTLGNLGYSVGSFKEFAELSPAALLLQYVYIVKNPGSPGSKSSKNSSTDIATNPALPKDFRIAFSKCMYAKAMDRYDGIFETVIRKNNYLDMMLVDDLGNVVYTFDKSWDFGTSIYSGWRKNSPLKKVFFGARFELAQEKDHGPTDQVVTADLERYPGSYGAPMMFLSSPISNRLGGRLGVLIHKVSGGTFTDMATFEGRWPQVGLGKTGEAYIVGPDKKLRTESRFLSLLPPRMKFPSYHADGSQGPLTAVLGLPLRNQAVEDIYAQNLSTREGEVTFFDDLGRESLGVYAPLSIPGLDWGIVITISTSEAFASAAHLTRLIAMGGLVTLILAVLGSLLFGHYLSVPIGQLVKTAEAIGSGDHSARAPISSRDEIGFLAERFNAMIDQVEMRNRQVHKILETVNEGLFLMTPDFIIQPGYSRITDAIFQRNITGILFLDLFKAKGQSEMTAVISPEVLKATTNYLELLLNPRVKEKLIVQTNPLSEVEFQLLKPRGSLKSKFLEFRFNRVIENGKTTQIMVTVLDSTSRIALTKQIRENEVKAASQIEMLFGILHLDPPVLSQFLSHTNAEIAGILSLLEAEQFGSHASESGSDRTERYHRLLKKISRAIHLIKGNAAMLRLSYFEGLANDLEEKIDTVRNNPTLTGEQFLPITTGLASLLDQVKMTHDLISRLLSMQQVFGGKEGRQSDLEPLRELATEVAERSGKRVRVEIQVPDGLTALPKSVREPIQAMLAQLIRNAVIHGIETPVERISAAKNPIGEVRIAVQQSSPQRIIIAVRDDGRGISYEVLKQRAVALGYATRETIETWTLPQITNLLFEIGFTTIDRPTIDGGRGVGLDAVRDLITKIGGELSVSSKLGLFTEFHLEIPYS
jgi:signal transduction histidine kinase/HAMP domain-containing protein